MVQLIEMYFCRIKLSPLAHLVIWVLDLIFLLFIGNPKTCFRSFFFRERRVLLVPPIADLGFFYPKLSKIFYW